MNTISSKCKNCGSELWYNPKENCLTCKYCSTNYFLPTKSDDAVMVRQYSSAFHPNQLNKMFNAYKCGGCGVIYYMSSEEKSKRCPNCGNHHSEIVEDYGYCADALLPFKISKEEASLAFEKYLKTQHDYPAGLRKNAKEQKLMGVYVPVWNFTYSVSSSYSANSNGIEKGFNGSYFNVTKPVFGEKHKRIPSLDILACSNEDKILLDLFDEDDYAGLIPYFPEYTYGYRIDSIDRDIHEYYYRFTEEAKNKMIAETKKYALNRHKDISDLTVDATVNDVFFNFAYVPVYVNTYNYRGKNYKTYISGTTGKVIGKPPKTIWSFFRKLIKFVGVVGIVALICYFCFK